MVKVSKLARKKLGAILVEEGLLKNGELEEALRNQKETGDLLGETLVRLGFVNETEIAMALSKQFGLPYIEADRYSIQKEILELVPAEVMVRNQFILLDKIGKILLVAVSGVIDPTVFEVVERRTGSEVFLFVSTQTQVMAALRKFVKMPAEA